MSQTTIAEFPLRHLSVRVPWHDAEWKGVICEAPHLNGSCAKLKGIAGKKIDEQEKPLAGRSLDELPREQWPCCVDERATFMAPFEMEQVKRHALAAMNPKFYGHFRPTPQRYPAFSAGIVPFAWMMRDNLKRYRELFEIDVDEAREPELGYDTNWVHEVQNQTALLEGFAEHLQKDESLSFFYAKHVPFIEGTRRILVGVGRIKDIGPLTEYKREGEGMRGMLWERPVQHSIRPKGKDGFLVPYLDLLRRAEQDPLLELERYAPKAPDEHWDEFSFASELVTHDGAIGALLSMETSLASMETELGIVTSLPREWIHDELVRLWKVRGPFPGLGAVLSAFGLSRGILVAHALQQKAGENKNPWPLVDAAFQDPAKVLPKELCRDLKELGSTWKGLKKERRAYLQLLSRFEVTKDQAKGLYDEASRLKQGWGGTDAEILRNPYRIYEHSRHDFNGVKLLTVDRGIFPDDSIRLQHPLSEPSGLDSALDLRRVRVFSIAVLEGAALNGHTLLTKDKVVDSIARLPVRPECPVTGDILSARLTDMAPEIVAVPMGEDVALQLHRYSVIGELVRKQVLGRIGGQRHVLNRDWKNLLENTFGRATDDEEKRARIEKAAVLKELAEARLSVLAGPAGAGKTSVLGVLCAQPEILNEGLLLLAPTGKARVRMQELAGSGGTKAFTIAQFLNQHGRYRGASGRYMMSDRPKATGFATVIVDESSMLTEDMLGAIFDALQGVKRFIFVGDPAQLPPIGAGRPFVDMVTKLRPANYEACFPRVAPGYAELTVERRQVGSDRPDLRLARWFSAMPPAPGEDDIFLFGAGNNQHVRFVEWEKPEDFQGKLVQVLVEELKLNGSSDSRSFNSMLGAVSKREYDYFNATRNGQVGAVRAVEAWQILSPLRGMPFGVGDINRQIHERFRAGFLELAGRQWRPIPKPFGTERIVYGDKVINLDNHRRDGKKVFPENGALGYLANGEIGIAVGQWKNGGRPSFLNVEFSSQQVSPMGFPVATFVKKGNPH
jgi:hypothetical protein